jgi:glutamate dehydrogenase (NAD(P)+)
MMHTRVLAEIHAAPAIERIYDDPATGYRAYVVIDSLACGTATGGIRIRPGLTLDEIRCTARTMTWKHRFIGLPNGGAKGGIEAAEGLPRGEKARRLLWLGRVAADLIDTGIWGIGPDMGTDAALITDLLHSRNLLARRRKFPARFRGSGFYTACSVVESAGAALALQGDTLRGKTVAIEGFGSVGSNVARLISSRGARLVAVSTSSGALYRPEGLHLEGLLSTPDPLDGDPRARRLPKEDLLRLEVDLLMPCGAGGTIDAGVAHQIAAPVIVPGANCAMGLDAARALHDRRRLAVPDFVSNCGGILGASLRVGGVPEWMIESFLKGPFRRRVSAFLRYARRENGIPLETALSTLPPLQGGSAPSGERRLLSWARSAARSRVVPRRPLAIPTYVYFAKHVGTLSMRDDRTRTCMIPP